MGNVSFINWLLVGYNEAFSNCFHKILQRRLMNQLIINHAMKLFSNYNSSFEEGIVSNSHTNMGIVRFHVKIESSSSHFQANFVLGNNNLPQVSKSITSFP